jgi:hypothetical protein
MSEMDRKIVESLAGMVKEMTEGEKIYLLGLGDGLAIAKLEDKLHGSRGLLAAAPQGGDAA